MSGLNIQNSRIQMKYSTLSGETPSIAPSGDHTDGTWTPTDIYVGEIFFNVIDDTAWFRSLNGIIPLTSGATYISTYLNITGGTMLGTIYGPNIEMTTISGGTIYGGNVYGTFIGDGSGLTGITANDWTGGTISAPATFLSDVDLCSANVSASTINSCGGVLEINGGLNVSGGLSATTVVGDGSGLTNLPYFSGITLDGVLTLGDTSTNQNINLTNGGITLTNGDITLTNGVFYGDGSGLTNLPPATNQNLTQVLGVGNTTGAYDIEFDNPNYGLFNTYDTGFVLNTHRVYFDSDGVQLYATNDATGAESFIKTKNDGGVYISADSPSTFNFGDTITIYGVMGWAGLEYDNDYSANFTNRSLVDKEYVDTKTSLIDDDGLRHDEVRADITNGTGIFVNQIGGPKFSKVEVGYSPGGVINQCAINGYTGTSVTDAETILTYTEEGTPGVLGYKKLEDSFLLQTKSRTYNENTGYGVEDKLNVKEYTINHFFNDYTGTLDLYYEIFTQEAITDYDVEVYIKNNDTYAPQRQYMVWKMKRTCLYDSFNSSLDISPVDTQKYDYNLNPLYDSWDITRQTSGLGDYWRLEWNFGNNYDFSVTIKIKQTTKKY